MNDKEHRLQVSCVRYFRYQFPDKMIFAVPNGAQRNIITAKKLKDEGVLAGVPDLVIPAPSGDWHGLFIEMKNGKQGRVSEFQQTAMHKLTEEGYRCAVVRSFEEFVAVVSDYFGEQEIQERIALNRERATANIDKAIQQARQSYKAQIAFEAAINGANMPICNDKLNYPKHTSKPKQAKKCDADIEPKHKPRRTITEQPKPCGC